MSGIGAEDLEPAERDELDFPRGSNGAPKVMTPDGEKSETYARTSSVGSVLEDDSALTNWRISTALVGQAQRPELVAAVLAAMPYSENKSKFTKLREEAIQAGRGSFKADLGTAVHAMSERWEEDPNYDPGPTYRPALELYSSEMARLGLKSHLIECKIVNDKHKIAGTADRIYVTTIPLVAPDMTVIPAGSYIIGDLKTGESLDFSLPGYTIQLAGYAGGLLYDVEAQRRIETPEIRQDWAIIVHLSVEKNICEFLWVNLEVGHRLLDAAALRQRRGKQIRCGSCGLLREDISGAAAIKRALACASFHPSVVRAMTLSFVPTSKRNPVLSPGVQSSICQGPGVNVARFSFSASAKNLSVSRFSLSINSSRSLSS